MIHYHKRISNKEFEPILKKIHAFDAGIPVFVVKVNSTRTEEYFVRDLMDDARLPKDGSVFRLKKMIICCISIHITGCVNRLHNPCR